MKKLLLIHREYLNTYHNKEMGHFIKFGLLKGYQVDFMTLKGRAEAYDGRTGDGFNVIETPYRRFGSFKSLIGLGKYARNYEYAWIYPFHKHLLLILLVLFLNGVKTILVLDGHYVVPKDAGTIKRFRRRIQALIIHLFCRHIFYESSDLVEGFWCKSKTVRYAAGLPRETLEMIKKLSEKIQRQKKILYPGLIVPIKGLDRLVDAFLSLKDEGKIDPEWQLEVVGRVGDQSYFDQITEKISGSEEKTSVFFSGEKKGEAYYAKVLESSLVVMPTQKESLPNVLQDAYFSHRLFLTTQGAVNAHEMFHDETFYCLNTQAGIALALEEVMTHIEEYYERFDSLYVSQFFINTDEFFSALIK